MSLNHIDEIELRWYGRYVANSSNTRAVLLYVNLTGVGSWHSVQDR